MLEKGRIKESYDRESLIYDKNRFGYPGGRYVDEMEKLHIIRFLKLGSVLELGCGTGRYAEFLTQNGYKYVGIDISNGMLKEAFKKSNKNSFFVTKMDAENLAFLSNKFDNVISVRAVKFFPNPPKVLREVHRVLKPNGRFIIIHQPTNFPIIKFLYFLRSKLKMDLIKSRVIENFYSNLEVLRWFERAGLKIIHRECFLNFAFYKNVRHEFIVKILKKIDNKIKRIGWKCVIVGKKD